MPEKYDCPRGPHDHDACITAKVAEDGIQRCYMCGDKAEECDKQTDDDGFNECDWLAEK